MVECNLVAARHFRNDDTVRALSASWLPSFYSRISAAFDNATYSDSNPDCDKPMRNRAGEWACGRIGGGRASSRLPASLSSRKSSVPSWKTSIESREPRGRAAWSMLQPLQLCGPANSGLSWLGRPEKDGSKPICGADALGAGPPFTVLSLGSNNNWLFEEAVVAHFGRRVRIHTYDCTVAKPTPPAHLGRALTFHRECVHARDAVVNGSRFVSWRTLMRDLAAAGGLVGRVEMMKIDVEGNEREWLWDMLSDPRPEFALPTQISLELHLPTVNTRGEHTANIGQRFASVAEVVALAMLWHAAGYRLIVRENNAIAPRGTELLLLSVAGCEPS